MLGKFKECFKDASKVLQGSFGKYQGCFKKVLRVVSSEIEGRFKGI